MRGRLLQQFWHFITFSLVAKTTSYSEWLLSIRGSCDLYCLSFSCQKYPSLWLAIALRVSRDSHCFLVAGMLPLTGCSIERITWLPLCLALITYIMWLSIVTSLLGKLKSKYLDKPNELPKHTPHTEYVLNQALYFWHAGKTNLFIFKYSIFTIFRVHI